MFPNPPPPPDDVAEEEASALPLLLVGEPPVRADDEAPPSETVEHPAKVMRIATMIKQLLEEVRHAPLDTPGRRRLKEIYETSVEELAGSLSADLRDELARVSLPFADDDEPPTEPELRIAQAQLVGWLEGLFHGIQATVFAQQMAARGQMDDRRQRSLPAAGDERRPPGYL